MYGGQRPQFLLPNRDLVLLAGLVIGLAVLWYLAGPAGLGGLGGGGGGRVVVPRDEFYWAVPDGPVDAVAEVDTGTARAAVAAARDVIDTERDDDFGIAIVATFETPAEATSQAGEVRRLLADAATWFAQSGNAARSALADPEVIAPISGPELDALEAAGIAPGSRGTGWGGAPADAARAVWTMDTMLFVTGLKSDRMFDEYPAPPLPLAQLLRRAGATVLLEGDRYGEGSIVTDLSCQPPDDATARQLDEELGDAILVAGYQGIPPWVKRPSPEQALARATVRRWQDASYRAMEDPRVSSIITDMVGASIEEQQRLSLEMQRILMERGPGYIDGPVDAEVLQLLLGKSGAIPSIGETDVRDEAIGRLIGAYGLVEREGGYRFPSADDYATLAYGASSRVEGGRLEIGYLVPVRFSAAGIQLLAYLTDAGCGDLRLRLLDYDDIRVD